MWVPGNPLARGAGIHEDPQQPRTYLQNELGSRYDAAQIDAFLDNAPRMVSFFEEKTALKFADGNAIPDVHGKVIGAGTQGHQVIAAPYDARELGALNKRLRKTMRETSFAGMPIMAGADLGAFLSMTRSAKSFLHVTARFLRHLRDLALHGRARHLVNGVALIGRLAKSADDLKVQLIESAPGKAADHRKGRGLWRRRRDGGRRDRDPCKEGRRSRDRRFPERYCSPQGTVSKDAHRQRASGAPA